MTVTLRVVLIIGSFFTTYYVARQVRKGKIEIDHSLFWIILSVFLLLTSIFPQYLVLFTKLMGVQSTSNMVFLLIIFILMVKLFMNSVSLSKMEEKISQLVQELTLIRMEEREKDDRK